VLPYHIPSKVVVGSEILGVDVDRSLQGLGGGCTRRRWVGTRGGTMASGMQRASGSVEAEILQVQIGRVLGHIPCPKKAARQVSFNDEWALRQFLRRRSTYGARSKLPQLR
jgi:hypothetical protein